jgi:hypothetical protein
LVTVPIVELDMEAFVEGGGDRDEKDLAITLVAAEAKLAASLLSLTLDFGESAGRDIYNN